MKKINSKMIITAICSFSVVTIACANISLGATRADADEQVVNLLATGADWAINSNGGEIEYKEGSATFKPVKFQGVVYKEKIGVEKISFKYQLEYAQELIDSGDAPFTAGNGYNVFFGILFGNNPDNVTQATAGLTIPWDAQGGYPYMLAFDSEIQGGEPNRIKQLGLTLRRYKYGGSHDFFRWSSVEPTEETFTNDAGVTYKSKVPAYNKPVTMADCFDTDEHSVTIETSALYLSKGDEADAVKIDVTFDGELCLTVIDEMPFVGDAFGEDVDKRGQDGWVSIFCYDGMASDLSLWNYQVKFSAFTVAENGQQERPIPDDNIDSTLEKKPGKGCKSSIGESGIACIGLCAVALLKKNKFVKF